MLDKVMFLRQEDLKSKTQFSNISEDYRKSYQVLTLTNCNRDFKIND